MKVKLQLASGLPNTSVRLIEVCIQADPDRTRQALESIDWEMLKDLLKPAFT